MQITTTKKTTHSDLKIGVFGQSGVGKSSLVKTLPCDPKHVLILNIEDGLEVLRGEDFAQISFSDIEAANPIDKMREVVKHLLTPDGLNGFKWIVIDSFSMWAEKVLHYMEKNPQEFDLLSSQGKFDGLKMYGTLKKVFTAVNDAILSIPNLNKLVLFGAMEKENGPDKRMEMLIPGSFGSTAMFTFDEFYGMNIKTTDEGVVRQLVTNNDGYFIAKSRMSGGAGNVLDVYEPAHLGNIISKCYSGAKKASKVDTKGLPA